jgi:hypothetical protein
MLRLTKRKLKASPVPIGGGAVLHLRPATSFDTERAAAAASILLAGLVEGHAAAMVVSAALGEEFQNADFTRPEWRNAASRLLVEIELAVLCCERVEGKIVDDDESVIDTAPGLTPALASLLMRDSVIRAKISDAVEARVHTEVLEKKESERSPPGAAAAGYPTAPTAGAGTSPAAAASGERTANVAPSSSTPQ